MIKLKEMIKEEIINKLLIEDPIDRSKGAEKKDQDADRVARDDGDTWMAPSGQYGAKYKGQIQYFDKEESAKDYASSGSKDSEGGGADKKDKEDEPGKLKGSDFDRQEDDPIGDKGDVGVGELPDRSSELPKKTAKQQSDFEKKKAAMFKKAKDKINKGGGSESETSNKVQSVQDIDDIADLTDNLDFKDKFDDVKDQDSGYEDEYGSPMTIDDINFKVNMINSGEDPQDFLGPFEDEDALVAAWSDATNRAMSSKKESKDSIKSWMKRLSRD